jgi:hypothetical protein
VILAHDAMSGKSPTSAFFRELAGVEFEAVRERHHRSPYEEVPSQPAE